VEAAEKLQLGADPRRAVLPRRSIPVEQSLRNEAGIEYDLRYVFD